MADARTRTVRRPAGAECSTPSLDRYITRAAVLLAAATAIVLLASALVAPARPEPESWTSVDVAAYGTLWEIAANHRVPGLSTAQTVELIAEENNLSSSTLYTGQVLRVPAPEDSALAVAQR